MVSSQVAGRWSATLATVVTLATSAAATTNELFGHGPRTQALAATGVARCAPEDAGYTNPARFSAARQPYISIGYQVAEFRLSSNAGLNNYNLSEAAHGLTLQLLVPLPLKGALQDKVGLGVGAYLPSQLLARAQVLYPQTPQFPLLASRAQALGFAAGIGIDVSHGLRIGAGFTTLAEVLGNVGVGSAQTAATGSEILATFSPIAGISYDLNKATSLGLVWRGEVINEFDVGLAISDLGLLRLPELRIAGVAHYDPMQVQGGVSYQLKHVELLLDGTVKLWSLFNGWQRATVTCPPSSPNCQALVPEPVPFATTVVPRVAAAVPLDIGSARAELRFGYFFEPSPMAEQTGTSNYWDNDRHALTLGYGISLGESLPLTSNIVWQTHFLVDRLHSKTSAATDNPGYPSAVAGGAVHLLSFNLGARF